MVELEESGKIFEMVVIGINKGGVVGDVEGLWGFIFRLYFMYKDNMDVLVG